MFSIIIPLYNKEHSVTRTICSILSQTYRDWELIIVNDGSTDNSRRNAEVAINCDPRCRILDQNNSGVSVARNAGAKYAQFEFVTFLDADDQWYPDFLATIKILISKWPDAAWYGTSNQQVSSEHQRNKILESATDFSQSNPLNLAGKVDFLKESVFAGREIVNTSSVVFKVDCFNEVGGFPVGVAKSEDKDLFFRIALRSKLIFYPLPKSLWNLDAENRVCRSIPLEILAPFCRNIDSIFADRQFNEETMCYAREYIISEILTKAWNNILFHGNRQLLSINRALLQRSRYKRNRRWFMKIQFVALLPNFVVFLMYWSKMRFNDMRGIKRIENYKA